jgi:hypothetical protein
MTSAQEHSPSEEASTRTVNPLEAQPQHPIPAEKVGGRKRILLWAVIALVGLWFLGHVINRGRDAAHPTVNRIPASPLAKGAPAHIAKLQETVRVGSISYSVWGASYRGQLSDDPYLDQPADASYLFVDLSVRNEDSQVHVIPPFILRDENGAEYESSNKGWLVEGSIKFFDSLNPGVEKRGVVVFDVPRGKRYHLQLAGGYRSDQEALVDLGL